MGMAMAARYERGLFDPGAPEGESPFDHTIWAIVSDGDLQEGVSAEASSLAGHQKLGNLVFLYDDNHISIEGDTVTAFSEDVLKRYEAYGWHTQRVEPAKSGDVDVRALHAALTAAKAETGRPSIIAMRTIIAWPAPNAQNTEASHGSALGADEIAATKRVLGFDPERSFEVADEVLAHTRRALDRGAEAHAAWDKRIAAWRDAAPERAALFDRVVAGRLPEGWEDALPVFETGKAVATRAASARSSRRSARCCPNCGAAPQTWPARTTRRSTRRRPSCPGATRSPAPTRTAAPCTSASASSPWPRR